MDLIERLGPGIRNDSLLQRFDSFTDEFQDGKILIDDRVDQRVEQVVGAGLPQSALATAQTLADRLKHVRAVLLERQDIIFPQYETHLLDGDFLSLRQ